MSVVASYLAGQSDWTPGTDGRAVKLAADLTTLRARNTDLYAQGYRMTALEAS